MSECGLDTCRDYCRCPFEDPSPEDRARTTLRQIAALITTLPMSLCTQVLIGCSNAAAVELLISLGGRQTANVSRGNVIIGAYLEVDGVEFAAQWDRPAIATESALLDSPAAHHHAEMVIAPLPVTK